MSLLGYQQLMVRALEVDIFRDLLNQPGAVLGEEWKDGIEPLLQMFVRVDQARKRSRIARCSRISRQHFPADLPVMPTKPDTAGSVCSSESVIAIESRFCARSR